MRMGGAGSDAGSIQQEWFPLEELSFPPISVPSFDGSAQMLTTLNYCGYKISTFGGGKSSGIVLKLRHFNAVDVALRDVG